MSSEYTRETKYIDANSELFPSILKSTVSDCKGIYVRGNLKLLQSDCIAVVGSRKASLYGKQVSSMIGRSVANAGLTLVSGLARGIDIYAQESALDAKQGVIAVLASGLNKYYPKEHRHIQERIQEEGLLISEYEDDVEPRKYHFPMRNRLISGISKVVIVVEAYKKSGALITAHFAMEQGKNVYAVPGNITSNLSMGTNQLISDGANIFTSVEDFLEHDVQFAVNKGIYSDLGELEAQVVMALYDTPYIGIKELEYRTGIEYSRLNGIVTLLEIKGVIKSQLGKFFIA